MRVERVWVKTEVSGLKLAYYAAYACLERQAQQQLVKSMSDQICLEAFGPEYGRSMGLVGWDRCDPRTNVRGDALAVLSD
jgi:hypothetical protein